MKKPIAVTLIVLFLIPVLSTWFPHNLVHVLHSEYAKNHGDRSHAHGDVGHDHEQRTSQVIHHPIHIDAISFVNDYLQIELKNSSQQTIKKLEPDLKSQTYIRSSNNEVYQLTLASSTHSRAPPDWGSHSLASLPLYLSTQRLRI